MQKQLMATQAGQEPDWITFSPIPGRADRTDLQVKRVGKNNRHKEHKEIGGKESSKVFTEESSHQGETTKQNHTKK